MPIKILLVDDNVDILVNVRDYFEMRGWTVETATTGTAAVERLERDAGFDLIVLDVGLPDVDGVALCRSLRSRGMKIPVLMLTSIFSARRSTSPSRRRSSARTRASGGRSRTKRTERRPPETPSTIRSRPSPCPDRFGRSRTSGGASASGGEFSSPSSSS